ncbi:MAG TPA: flagellar biosynthesis protein FliQ [Fimbriimonas sp.]|nr:flagellar biosynthesis protein FliQ [Fimbriimonas sp.]
MEQGYALEISRQGVEVAIMVMLPLLAVSLFIGLLVSVLQAVTSVQETTLTFVPKLIGVAVMLTFMGNWMLMQIISYTHVCFQRIAEVGR